MKRRAVPLALVAVLVAAAPAPPKTVSYSGKTDSGHKMTFTVKGKRVVDLTSGIRVSCVPIQGGGMPTGGSELFGFKGSVPLGKHATWTFMSKPAFHYNEVTMNHDLWFDQRSARSASGRMRIQYSFLIPKYPIGTFSVYSCLGTAKFNVKARG